MIDAAKELDQHPIPTRYPNGFERGSPADFHRNPVTLVTPIVSTSGIKVYLVTRSHRIASRNHERRIS